MVSQMMNRLEAEYIPIKDDTRKHLFEEMGKKIREAKNTIYVVNYFTGKNEEELSDEDIDEPAKEARNKYYGDLIQKSVEGVNYQRIIQLHDPKTPAYEVVKSQSYHLHFRDMLSTKKIKKPANVLVRPVQRPSTFILVDDKYLLWQINELIEIPGGTKPITRMHGMFVFTAGKDDELIKSFQRLCNELIQDDSSGGHPFTYNDLPQNLRPI
jgi:hypothetical protein